MSDELLATICRKLAKKAANFTDTIGAMEKGPPPKGQPRKQYDIPNVGKRDVYQLVVRALGSDPPKLSFTKSEIQTRVSGIAGTQVSSVWESVKHMTSIANRMHETLKLDVRDKINTLFILDPYLLFSLRWGRDSK